MGWKLIVHPDGTSQVVSPDGKTIRSHSPPPRPGQQARAGGRRQSERSWELLADVRLLLNQHTTTPG